MVFVISWDFFVIPFFTYFVQNWTMQPVWPDVGIKSDLFFPKVAQILGNAIFILKIMLFKIAQELSNIFGYICKKICCRDLAKIARSGHTGCSRGEWTLSGEITIMYQLVGKVRQAGRQVGQPASASCVDLKPRFILWPVRDREREREREKVKERLADANTKID